MTLSQSRRSVRSHASRSSLHRVRTMPSIDEDEEAPLRIPPKSPRRKLPQPPPRPYVPDYVLYEQVVRSKEFADGPSEYGASDGVGESEHRGLCCGWRRRWCWALGAIIAITIVTVGLAVGLTLGLEKGSHQHMNNAQTQENASYPIGSYTFNTTLRTTDTSCTNNSATWRCYPYGRGVPVKFFWIIHPDYTISSTDNPFAPSFDNLTMTLHDANSSTERFTFSYNMSKTVIPDESITSDDRAAKCTFSNTVFEATLWTRRNEGVSEASTKFASWPGDTEVVQKQDAEVGALECLDDDGDRIESVGAGSGECLCEYSSL